MSLLFFVFTLVWNVLKRQQIQQLLMFAAKRLASVLPIKSA
jgi:hypothetical protein